MITYFDLIVAYLFMCAIVAVVMAICTYSMHHNNRKLFHETFGDTKLPVAIFFSMMICALLWPVVATASLITTLLKFLKR